MIAPLGLCLVLLAGCDRQPRAELRSPGPARTAAIVNVESTPSQAIAGERIVIEAAVREADGPGSSNLRLDVRLEDVSGRESAYAPPGNEGFYFYGYRHEALPPLAGSAIIGDEGVAAIPFTLAGPAWSRTRSPVRLTLTATLRDVASGAALASSRTVLLVHPAAVYVGVRPARRFLPSGEPIEAEAIVVDAAGRVVAGRPVDIAVTEQRSYPIAPGETTEVASEERPVGRCSRVSGEAPVACRFPPERPGEYWIEARALDAQGRQVASGSHLYIHGSPAPPWQHPASPAALQLALDRESYEAGGTAEIWVRAPFEGGHGTYTIESTRNHEVHQIEIQGSIGVVSVAVVEAFASGVDVAFELEAPGAARRRARGRIRLPVGR